MSNYANALTSWVRRFHYQNLKMVQFSTFFTCALFLELLFPGPEEKRLVQETEIPLRLRVPERGRKLRSYLREYPARKNVRRLEYGSRFPVHGLFFVFGYGGVVRFGDSN